MNTDTELLAKADADSFAEFYRRHARRIAGYLTRATGDPEIGADLTAETFAAALDGLSRYRPEQGAPATWLYGIAAHKVSEWRRRVTRRTAPGAGRHGAGGAQRRRPP